MNLLLKIKNYFKSTITTDKIVLELNSYNIEECTTKLINKVVKDNPTLTMQQLSDLLGVSSRTFIRYVDIGKVSNYKKKKRSKKCR